VYFKPRVNVTEMSVTLYPVSGVVFPQRTVYLGSGGVVDLPVEVPADVVGNVAIGYKVAYTLASGFSGEYTATLNLVASQRPALALDAAVTPERPRAGEPFYVAVRLYNSGGVEARDVRLNVSGPVKVVRAPSPLGAVAPQASKDALFTLVAEEPGVYNLTVTATYTDRLGRVYTSQRSLSVVINASRAPAQTVSAPQRSSSDVLPVLLLVAAGVAVVVFGIWRGRAGRSR
jgi:hypothetical protein